MATSPSQLTNALSEEVIPRYWVSYFREYARGAVHDQLLEMFEAWKRRGFNRAGLAKKLERRPEQITRWLSAPSNLEIDTISDIALAMGCVPKIGFESIEGLQESRNGRVEATIEVEDPEPLDLPMVGETGSSGINVRVLQVS